jgi:ABC-type Fe3+/spermidine/putrescine transport system ATPase subunit
MTIADNLGFGLKLRKLEKTTVAARVRTALELVGLSGMEERYAGELSGGQQQRVALARAIALEPQILLFDEPLSNLDAKMRERMRFEVRQLQKRLGITSIYVTHDQQEAMAIADRIVLMNNGRIEQQGAPRDLYENPRSRFAADFIGSTNVLSGRVTASGQIRINDAFEIAAAKVGFAAGASVDVLVRPEHIRIGAGMNGNASHLDATVTSVCFLGSIADVDIEIAGQPLQIQLSPPGHLKVGDALRVSIDPANVVVLENNDTSGRTAIPTRSTSSVIHANSTTRSAQGGAS